MAPKKNARDRPTSPVGPVEAVQEPTPAPAAVKTSTATKGGRANWDEVLLNIAQHYTKETPQRTKLIDVFLFFLVVVGGLQFLYCVLAGNYVRSPRGTPFGGFFTDNSVQPFNAFLSGFCATVGQYVLTSMNDGPQTGIFNLG